MSQEQNWLAKHRRIATIATALAIPPLLMLGKDLRGQALFFIANVLLFGVSHGALDHLQCPPGKNGRVSWLRFLAFGAIYLSLSGLVLYVWLHDPGPMLVSFLSVSCLHFAMDEDRNLSFVQRLLGGFLPVLAPCFLHMQEVGALFSFLIDSQAAFSAEMISVLQMVGFILIGIASASIVVETFLAMEKRSLTILADVLAAVVLIVAYILLPPLLSFTIYFCWWHSLRQSIKLVARFKTNNFSVGLDKFVKAAAPLTLGSWLLALIIYLLLPEKGLGEDLAQQIRTIFYLLSALTIPHMFLGLFGAEVIKDN